MRSASSLSPREHAVLAAIGAHERRADPAFARRLRRVPGAAVALAVPAALAVLGVVVMLLPGAWFLAAVGALALAVPVLLVRAARRQGLPHADPR